VRYRSGVDMTKPLLVRRYARRYPLLAVLVLVALLLPSLGGQLKPAGPQSKPASNVMSADGWELSSVPGTRSVGKSDAERHRAPEQLPHVFFLVALAFAMASRGWSRPVPREARPPRAGFVEPRGARAPPVHI
jgi:hypothetical protein